MKIWHITEDHSVSNTGVTTALTGLHHQLLERGIGSRIIAVNALGDIERNALYVEQLTPTWNPWRYAPGLKRVLAAQDADLFHIHGVWMYPQWKAMQFAHEQGIPFVVSFHGMLQPWFWRHTFVKYIKKKTYFYLMLKKALLGASMIHALSERERASSRKLLGPDVPVRVIPNAMDVMPTAEKRDLDQGRESPYGLFLGRLHEVKGLELLIRAISLIDDQQIKFKIVGPGDSRYVEKLKKLAREQKIAGRICFTGPAYGQDKWQLIREAELLVVPSYSEGLGMVNLEGAAVGVPVITTFQTGIDREWSNHGGLLIEPAVDELTGALNTVLALTGDQRKRWGVRLRNFARERYGWERVADEWVMLYKGIMEGVYVRKQ